MWSQIYTVNMIYFDVALYRKLSADQRVFPEGKTN